MAQWSDFIGEFMDYSEGVMSPAIFRKWSAIALCAGALERRVWARTGKNTTYPNLYTLLVAPPGVGKLIIEDVRNLWTLTVEPGGKSPAFKVAPDNMTKASMIDRLAKTKTTKIPAQGPPITYSSLLVAAEEFSVLMPNYDLEFIGVWNSLYGNKILHEEARRHGPAKEVRIEYPQLNILSGVQPAILGSTFPEEAWSSGLARRIIMIYAGEGPLIDIFAETESGPDLRSQLLRKLSHFSAIYGQMQWEDDAADLLRKWHLAGGPPIPTHTKLVDYCRSRTQFIIKLTIISSISRSGRFCIGLNDVQRAMEWLFEVEVTMPDIFRAMTGRSDRQVIEELYIFAVQLFRQRGKKPVDGASLRAFLLDRVPHEKVESLLRVAESSNVLDRVGGTADLFLPSPKKGVVE